MTDYYMLMCSLPRHARTFKVSETPISRIQLNKRLRFLTEEDRHLLGQLENVLWHTWFSPHLSIKETRQLATPLFALPNPFIHALLNWFFDLRSLFTAIRLRQQGNTSIDKQVFLGELQNRLVHNYQETDFRLKYIYPWLPEINKKMTNRELAATEDMLISQLWKHLNIIEGRHYFDFPAVIIYVLRWNIVNYWSHFNEKSATDYMHKLVRQACEGITYE